MNPNEKAISTFETRVRQMILRFQELKKENQELYSIVEKNEQAIKDLQDDDANFKYVVMPMRL